MKSNTVVGDSKHSTGVVLAEIVRANIPVKNGVVHLIHRPLMVVDTTVKQFLEVRFNHFVFIFHFSIVLNVISFVGLLFIVILCILIQMCVHISALCSQFCIIDNEKAISFDRKPKEHLCVTGSRNIVKSGEKFVS